MFQSGQAIVDGIDCRMRLGKILGCCDAGVELVAEFPEPLSGNLGNASYTDAVVVTIPADIFGWCT